VPAQPSRLALDAGPVLLAVRQQQVLLLRPWVRWPPRAQLNRFQAQPAQAFHRQ
jgi:hypothetical protein